MIEKIEGLEHLTKLTDLSLHHNLISEIDGLDYQTELECVSLGENQIQSLDEVAQENVCVAVYL